MSEDCTNSPLITFAFVAEVIDSMAPTHRPSCVETKVRVVRGHLRRGLARVVDSEGRVHSSIKVVGVVAGGYTESSDSSRPTVIVLVRGTTVADIARGWFIVQDRDDTSQSDE